MATVSVRTDDGVVPVLSGSGWGGLAGTAACPDGSGGEPAVPENGEVDGAASGVVDARVAGMAVAEADTDADGADPDVVSGVARCSADGGTEWALNVPSVG
ncbi:MAG: hypothetical protein AAF531_19765 [Actinomycetota bacterium]